jgi:hypothetical protein
MNDASAMLDPIEKPTSMPEPMTWHFNKEGQCIPIEINGPVGAGSDDVLIRLAVEGWV